MSTPSLFVVTFEHAHRAFKCVRLDDAHRTGSSRPGPQWLVTLDSRTVWSFDAQPGDTREAVQQRVERWWDEVDAAR
jgi:hypothetical protein